MAYFLAKTDPDTYTIDHLESDQRTAWDGVANPQAVRAIRSMQPGDIVFVYHSGGESAIVGLMTVLSPPRDDPRNPKSAIVDVQFLCRLPSPTTLSAIKQCNLFADWSLVRQSRLSTMSAPQSFVQWMRSRYPGVEI
ncbi:MAG: EVE domain-containing protein [Bryobacterales bacterium]|nr:EVE domain-containing protein [Bryobacterales bacterium]